MLRWSLWNYSDSYLLVKGTIIGANTAAQGAANNAAKKKKIIKNCLPLTNCLSRINNTQVDDAHDIDAVMAMYNLIEYGDNYSKTSGILWQYCRNKLAINAANGDIVDFNADYANTSSFKIKEKIAGQTGNNGTTDVEIMIPLKYLSNFWKTLEIHLINCEINLDENWFQNGFIVAIALANQSATFSITDTKLFVQVVTLASHDNAKMLEQLKSGYKRKINWNKYQSRISTKRPNQYLD